MSPVAPKYYDTATIGSEDRKRMTELKARIYDAVALSDAAQTWLTDVTLLRYLRARAGSVDKAEEMLRATLSWREAMRPEQIFWADIRDEAKTGKLFIRTQKDKGGRWVLVMRPRNENTRCHDGQIRNLIYMMETVTFLADEDETVQITILQDFEGYSLLNAPPLKTTRETLSILQAHYPERLSVSLMYKAPSLFSYLWRAISPFIDPVTNRKIVFVDKGPKGKETLSKYFQFSTLDKSFGGMGPSDFVFEEFEQRMLQIDLRRCVQKQSHDS